MAVTFSDDFNGGSGTLDARSGWNLLGSKGVGEANLDSGGLSGSATGGGSNVTFYTHEDTGVVEQYMQVRHQVAYDSLNPGLNAVDKDNYLCTHYAGTGASGARVREMAAGVRSNIVTSNGAASVAAGVMWRVETNGTGTGECEFFINDSSISTFTLPSALTSATRQGIGTLSGGTTGNKVDDYEAGNFLSSSVGRGLLVSTKLERVKLVG